MEFYGNPWEPIEDPCEYMVGVSLEPMEDSRKTMEAHGRPMGGHQRPKEVR